MRRLSCILMAAMFLVPRSSAGIQLHWISGASDLTFTAATRCTLVVDADAGATLPDGWRLLWVAGSDSAVAVPLVFLPEAGVGDDPVAACELVEPSDPASVAARILGASFCAASPGAATAARLILDAATGTRARLQVVAFEPSPGDSMDGTITRSPEITLNGGCADPYPPVVFRAASTHRLGQLDVTLRGANLGGVSSVPISASDSSWSYPLALTSKTDDRITAHAVLAAPLPDITVGAADGGTGLGAALLPADNFTPPEPQSCSSNFEGAQDTSGMQPKDFAFIDAGDSWHIFYTRQYLSGYTDRTNTRRIGHAKSTDQHLSTWTVVDRSAIQVREGRIWDNLHVWAPTIVRKPGDITYYMFYTGVQLDTIQPPPQLITSEIQRIGVAKSVTLDTWEQDSTPVYFNKKASWTFQDSSRDVVPIGGGQFYSDAWQFRDAFVMSDPENHGKWLMYFVTIDSTLDRYVVGVARTAGTDLRVWQDVWPLRRTSAALMNADRDESPHALFRQGNWWLLYTSNHEWGDQITYSLNATSPVDSSTWSQPDSLKAITCGQHPFPTMLNQWHATEYVGIGSNEYLSAFADNLLGGGQIQFTQIRAPDSSCPSDSIRLDCPDVWTGVQQDPNARTDTPIRLALSGRCPVRSSASLRLTLSSGGLVRVTIYDVFGRRVRTLLDRWTPAGVSTFTWDSRMDRVASGIYFARASGPGGRAVVRFPFLR